MLGDGDNACQAAAIRPEDRVGFIDRMLYTAKLIGITSLIHNGFLISYYIYGYTSTQSDIREQKRP